MKCSNVVRFLSLLPFITSNQNLPWRAVASQEHVLILSALTNGMNSVACNECRDFRLLLCPLLAPLTMTTIFFNDSIGAQFYAHCLLTSGWEKFGWDSVEKSCNRMFTSNEIKASTAFLWKSKNKLHHNLILLLIFWP